MVRKAPYRGKTRFARARPPDPRRARRRQPPGEPESIGVLPSTIPRSKLGRLHSASVNACLASNRLARTVIRSSLWLRRPSHPSKPLDNRRAAIARYTKREIIVGKKLPRPRVRNKFTKRDMGHLRAEKLAAL